MPFPISENFDVSKAWTFDTRNMRQSYAALLELTPADFIPNGFPVSVYDLNPELRGIYICTNETAPLQWEKIGGLGANATNITHAAALIATNLVPGKLYRVTNRPNQEQGLQGDIVLKATSASKLDWSGVIEAFVPDYSLYPEWHPTLSDSVLGDQPAFVEQVIHSGKTWALNGDLAAEPGTGSDWLPGDNTRFVVHLVEYDLEHDWISKRADELGNVVASSFKFDEEWYGDEESQVRYFPWGNPLVYSVGLTNVRLDNDFLNWKNTAVFQVAINGGEIQQSVLTSSQFCFQYFEDFSFLRNTLLYANFRSNSGFYSSISDCIASGLVINNVIFSNGGIASVVGDDFTFATLTLNRGRINMVPGSLKCSVSSGEVSDGDFNILNTVASASYNYFNITNGSFNGKVAGGTGFNIRGRRVFAAYLYGDETYEGSVAIDISKMIVEPAFSTLVATLTLSTGNYNNTTKTLTIPFPFLATGRLLLDSAAFGDSVTIRKLLCTFPNDYSTDIVRLETLPGQTLVIEESASMITSSSGDPITLLGDDLDWAQFRLREPGLHELVATNQASTGSGGGPVSVAADQRTGLSILFDNSFGSYYGSNTSPETGPEVSIAIGANQKGNSVTMFIYRATEPVWPAGWTIVNGNFLNNALNVVTATYYSSGYIYVTITQ